MKLQDILENLNGEHSVQSLGKEVQIGEKKLRETLKTLGFNYDNSTKEWTFSGEENVLDTDIHEHVQKKVSRERSVQKSTTNNSTFTEHDIKVLKELIQERKSDIELFSEYRIYDELSKVPTDTETVRNAYNISKKTTERLKKYATVRRLPLQDLVELAIINLLDKYEK